MTSRYINPNLFLVLKDYLELDAKMPSDEGVQYEAERKEFEAYEAVVWQMAAQMNRVVKLWERRAQDYAVIRAKGRPK